MKKTQKKKTLVFKVGDKNYYTIAGAVSRSESSESTIKRAINARLLKAMRHPKGWLILDEWIDEWLERRTTITKKRYATSISITPKQGSPHNDVVRPNI